ncbi:MAG: PKD domain-containing protein [Candidatus Kariarchaeaceae archaeon]
MKKIILILLVGFMFAANPIAMSCTVFHASNEEFAFGGNNEDWSDPDTYIYFIPPTDTEYGMAIVGYTGNYWIQGGMNEKGVFWDGLACPFLEVLNSTGKPYYPGNIFEYILQVCETCDQALDILDQYNMEILERAQILVGDQYGDSFIIEGDIIHQKSLYYQVATNFYLSQHPDPPYPCWRYTTALAMFESNGVDNLSADFCVSVLDAVHQEGAYPTQYSTLYDLKNQLIYVYYYHNYNQVKVFDLAEELELGYHEYSIPALFETSPDKPEKPSGPMNGQCNESHTYSTTTSDLYGDDIYYLWDWGDGEFSEWLGPYESGEIVEAFHVWETRGLYNIKVKAKDIYDCESDWSDPLRVRMPINQGIPNMLLSWLLEHFPNAFPILRYVFGL